MKTKVEYRVKPVTRYIVTRFEQQTSDDERMGSSGAVAQRGEFVNAEIAYHVAYALCTAEHSAAGAPLDSPDFIYPKIPDGVVIEPIL